MNKKTIFIILILIITKTNVVSAEWHNTSFGMQITVTEQPSYTYHNDSFGSQITVTEPTRMTTWHNTSFGINITVTNNTETNQSGYVLTDNRVISHHNRTIQTPGYTTLLFLIALVIIIKKRY